MRASIVGMYVYLAGCAADPSVDRDGFSDAEWEIIATLGPLDPPPPDPTNRYGDDQRAAAFGQRLYFERGYAGPLTVGDDGANGGLGAVGEVGRVACSDCHIPATWFMDTRSKPNATSLGATWSSRNTPGLVDAAHYKWTGWAGRADSMWMRSAIGPEIRSYGGGNRLQWVHVLYAKYRADYDAVFPVPLDPALDPAAPDSARFPAAGKPKAAATDPDGAWEGMTEDDRQIVNTILANAGKALDAYQRRLASHDAPLDRYIEGDHTALRIGQKRGLRLFIGKAACVACHSGTAFTDNSFHNTGVVQQVGDHVPATDSGRYNDVTTVLASAFNGAGRYSDDPVAGAKKLADLAQVETQRGQFRTKLLRNIAMTAPYMHNGSIPTLEAVIDFYDAGGAASGFDGVKDALMVPLNLAADEKTDLVDFLGALTGTPPDADLLFDTSAP